MRVRIRLEEAGAESFVGQNRYSLLCEVAAHVNPSTSPNAHNALQLSVVGGALFQPVGAELALNECATPLSLIGFYGAELAEVGTEQKEALQDVSIGLVTTLSDVQITNMQLVWSRMQNGPAT